MSKFTLKRSKGGFTLIEIMIVVLIIGILLAIAIPNFMNARDTSRTKSCIANLKQIDTAKQQYAMDAQLAAAAPCAAANLVPKYIKVEPTCPTDKTAYTINPIDTDPTCANAASGHVLPTAAAAAP